MPVEMDATTVLTPQDTKTYWDRGFHYPIRVLSPERAATERAAYEAMEAEYGGGRLPKSLNIYKRINSHVVMPRVAQLAQDPAILDPVESILGPDILLYSAEFFVKEAGSKSVVSMHQDITYWGLGAIDGLLTAWLALSPATRESGCMEVVAGSHKNAILPHKDTFAEDNLLSRGQEVAVDVAPEDRTAMELQPGEMSIHHGMTIHGSGANVSDDRRIGLAFRFMRPDLKQEIGEKDFALLVRGEDKFNNFQHLAVPGKLFDETSLALHETIRRAQAKAMMAGANGKNSQGLYD